MFSFLTCHVVDRGCLPDGHGFGLANNDILALGLGIYFGSGKYIWYKGCFSSHFSVSSFIEPDALDNF